MAENMSLDSILDETPQPIEQAPEQQQEQAPLDERSPKVILREKEQAAREEGQPRTEDGKFAPTSETPPVEAKVEEKPKAPEQQEMTPKERALLAAATDERKKRQELEARLAALEKPKEEPKPFWDDPEGAMKHLEKRIEGVALNTRLNTAETIARSKYQDFDEKVAVFAEIVQQNPGVQSQWLNSPDPAEFAYKMGKNHQDIQQLGSLDAVKAKMETDLRAKVRAELEAEYKAKIEASAKEREALTPSLSDARGTAVNRPVWSGPTSLDDILK